LNLPEIWLRILGFTAVIIFLLLGWSGSYWVTTWFYESIHYVPQEFTRQIINSFLGFFIFGCCMYFFTRIKWVRTQQDKFLHPLLHAMRMMAEGNFNIDLSYYKNQIGRRNDHPYQKLIESIHHMADKLGKMEEMRQEFISNVSHEIQSPLTSISGFAYALKNDELSTKERKHYLEIIEMESLRLSKLSENLLKLTSLESEHQPFELKNYRLDHQLRRIILANEPQWAEKEIHFDISLENVTITADEELMDQVWINLIHNSIKFTPKAGTISVEALKTDDYHRVVKIKDTGIGMDKEAKMHMFERFYKADKSRNRNHGGSGLGLSIAKKIVDMHQGEIRVRSEPGKGTEILVRLWENPPLQ
jgi:two-component system phosphate regulon sensor histidine kinase PhoR